MQPQATGPSAETSATATPAVEAPSAVPTPTLAATLLPSASVTTVQVSSAAPSAPPRPVPCTLLPIDICSRGERFTFAFDNRTALFVGFSFEPGAVVPVHAPAEGHLLLTGSSGRHAAIIKTRAGLNYEIKAGNIDLSKWGSLLNACVVPGDVIGYARMAERKAVGPYDLMFTISSLGPEGRGVVNEPALNALFPRAFARPVNGPFSGLTPGGTGVFFPMSCD